MKKALVIAGASVDKIIHLDKLPQPVPGTIFSKNSYDVLGSTGCGKAMSLCKLGFKTTFHATIGLDKSGDYIKSNIEKQGINFIYDIDSSGTEEHVNLMNDKGDRLSIYTKYSATEPQIDLNNFNSMIDENDYIILNIINYAKKIIPLIKEHKKEIWCDIHDYDGSNPYYKDFIEASHFIFMSSDCMKDYKSFMMQLVNDGKKLVVCTHGKNGSTALKAGEDFVDMPVIAKYHRIDTNGAGDNFFAGFLYAYDRGLDIRTCMQYGTIAAGLCIQSQEIVFPNLNEFLLKQEYDYYFGEEKNHEQ